jgi:thiosulfate/3-mercaptopyruvate sulfurtransferase
MWATSGRPLAAGAAAPPEAREFTAAPWPVHRLASAEDTVALAAAGGAVLDARAPERFRGEVAMVDPRPGHLPGARNAPWASVLGADGRLKSPDALRAHYAALGADSGDVVAYCGSGVSACMNVLAMEHAGLTPPRLFVASWSGWSADPGRPAEVGDGTR